MENRPAPKETKHTLQPKKYKMIGIVALCAALFIAALVILFFKNKSGNVFQYSILPPQTTPTVLTTIPPTPTPAPIAQGRQVYRVQSNTKGPKLVEVVIDPFDPKIGEDQMMNVLVSSTTPATSVRITLTLDQDKSEVHELEKSDATKSGQLWIGTWKTQFTHNYQYLAKVEATNAQETSKIDMTLR